MKYLLILFLTLVNFTSNAAQVTIIELHDNSIDQALEEEKFDEVFLKLHTLLLEYKLSEACDYRHSMFEKDFPDELYGYVRLKLDIFCLVLMDKLDEASLLNSLLMESDYRDSFFQDLFEELMYRRNKIPIGLKHARYNHELLPLYSAMIRVGEIYRAWSVDFLQYDELLIPGMIIPKVDKELRIKAARYAYRSGLLTKKKSDSCIEAIEKGINIFTPEADCLKSAYEDQKQIDNNTLTIEPFDKPEF